MNLFPPESNLGQEGRHSAKPRKWLDKVLGIKHEHIPTMTYEWIVRYFANIRENDPTVEEAVVLSKPYEKDAKLTQLTLICLDKDGEAVVGEKKGKTYIREFVVNLLETVVGKKKGKTYIREFVVDLLDEELAQHLEESQNVLRFSLKSSR